MTFIPATSSPPRQIFCRSLSTQSLEGQTQLPACRYEILSDVSGPPIKYAHIGDMVYHKWSCASELTDIYCMRVHSCTVNDGQGGPPVTVIDANGWVSPITRQPFQMLPRRCHSTGSGLSRRPQRGEDGSGLQVCRQGGTVLQLPSTTDHKGQDTRMLCLGKTFSEVVISPL